MSRTRVRRRRLAALAVAGAVAATASAGLAGHAFAGGAATRPAARHVYVVRSGDTLWSIAQRVAPERDPRPLVDAISKVNGIDAGALVPGRALVIPAGD